MASISDAARQLRGLGRRWHLHPLDMHRRAALIEQSLPRVRIGPLEFGAPLPAACAQALGAWTLWDTDSILASPETSSPFPDGQVDFVENRLDPPGRAYLKLWEAFTLLGRRPVPGELCLDLGAAPGG
ncbi:MAG: hypothetical protein IKH84_04515, partial [Ottowia sp.]|nr:hypothetical protein [Ottowia sp.]